MNIGTGGIMHPILQRICEALDSLQAVTIAAWSDDRTLIEVHGWHHPALTRHDLAAIPKSIADRLREADLKDIPATLENRLAEIPRRLGLLHPTTVPYMFNGNGHQAIPAYMTTLEALQLLLQPLLGWQALQDNKALPVALIRRLRSIQADLDSLVPNKESLEQNIRLIGEATEAAESLPTDLQTLRAARERIATLVKDADKDYFDISLKKDWSETTVGAIKAKHDEADKLVQQCEEAYRITTTKGLAAAFDQRATSMARSMWVWVFGLLCALGVGAYLGADRLKLLSTTLSTITPEWGTVWMQVLLSVFSIGAPLWFAWIATKQIGQRFRIAEDYAFKASVAKAYEGYRKEAARIDETFEARLFASALTRLEEAPLRLVEGESHGSPWHELVASPAFQNALRTVPELRDKFIEHAKMGLDVLKPVKSNKSLVEPKPEVPRGGE